jgi:hypothetical protein
VTAMGNEQVQIWNSEAARDEVAGLCADVEG